MSGLIRTVNFIEQPIMLVARKTVVPVTTPAPRFAEPERLPERVEEPRHEREVRPVEAVPQEPRFTYEEFMRRFEPELIEARERAVEEGRAQGMAEGREQGAAEYDAQLTSLSELIASARMVLDQGIEGVDDIAVEIVYESVAKIIGTRMTDREVVVSVVREVIQKAKERNRLVARVAPHDFELINGNRARLIDGFNVGEVEIVADDRVRMGGCLLETPAGNLDGRLEIQLGQLRDVLLNARARQE